MAEQDNYSQAFSGDRRELPVRKLDELEKLRVARVIDCIDDQLQAIGGDCGLSRRDRFILECFANFWLMTEPCLCTPQGACSISQGCPVHGRPDR